MKMQYLKNVVSIKIDQEKCIGCKICLDVCPQGVIDMNEKAYLKHRDDCIECGACKMNCPAAAITVNEGVGCAAAIYNGLLTNSEPTCGCRNNKNKCC